MEIPEDPEIKENRIKKQKKRYCIIAMIIVLLIGGTFITDNVIREQKREQRKREDEEARVFVPNLLGKTVAEADEILRELGVDYEFSTSNPGVGGKNYASTEPDAIVKFQNRNGYTMYYDKESLNEDQYIDKRRDKITLTAMTEDMINGTGEYYVPSSNSKYYYGY